MSFVADHKLKVRQPVFELGAADDIQRVIGRKDHAHVLRVVALLDFLRQPTSIGRRRVAQLMREHLHDVFVFVPLLADFGIGTDRKAVQRHPTLLRPLGQRL